MEGIWYQSYLAWNAEKVQHKASQNDPINWNAATRMIRFGLRGVLLLLAMLAGAAVVVYETWWNDFSSLNHYEALGVPETAHIKDIKRAYRERSLQFHPDKSASGKTELSTKRFYRISGTLRTRDPVRRTSSPVADTYLYCGRYCIVLHVQRRIKC